MCFSVLEGYETERGRASERSRTTQAEDQRDRTACQGTRPFRYSQLQACSRTRRRQIIRMTREDSCAGAKPGVDASIGEVGHLVLVVGL